MRIIIQRMKKTDIEEVIKLWKKLVREHQKKEKDFPREISTAGYIKLLKKNITKKDCCPLVAIDNKKIIGYCFVFYNKQRGEIRFRNFFVEEKYRNKGVGKQLVQEVVTWAKNNKIKKIRFRVYSFNERVIKFWMKRGAREVHREMVLKI